MDMWVPSSHSTSPASLVLRRLYPSHSVLFGPWHDENAQSNNGRTGSGNETISHLLEPGNGRITIRELAISMSLDYIHSRGGGPFDDSSPLARRDR